MEIAAGAKAGECTMMNMGKKMEGGHRCPDCRQTSQSDEAKQLR